MNVFQNVCELTDPTDKEKSVVLDIRQAAYLRDKLNEWLPYYEDARNFKYAKEMKAKIEAAKKRLRKKVDT